MRSILSCGRATAVVLSLFVAPGLAQAATYDVLQQRSQLTHDGNEFKSTRSWINRPMGGSQSEGLHRVGSFYLKKKLTGTTDPYQDFIAFCVEITTSITTSRTTPVTYTENPNLLEAPRRALIATLFGKVYDSSADAAHQTALQLTLWKLIYGDISTPTGNAFDILADSDQNFISGYMSYTHRADGSPFPSTFDTVSPGVFNTAQTWLDALNGDGVGDWAVRWADNPRMTYLEAGRSQNLVAYSPSAVPVPASIALLAGAIGAVGVAGKRRRRRD